MTLRSSVFLLTLPLLLLFGCDSSGGGSGPPDSVTGTWTGSHTVSAEVDTTVDDGNEIQATGEITRSYELVVAESEDNLSVEITIKDTGSVEYNSGEPDDLDRSVAYSASGTYGPPTMVITDAVAPSDISTNRRWKFEVDGGTAEGDLDVGLSTLAPPPNSSPSPSYLWTSKLNDKGEDTSLTLEKQ